METVVKLGDISSAVIESVPELPVTVKMRAGWSNDKLVSTEAGPRLEERGVKAIALHPRTTKQSYKGNAKWELIRDLKNAVSVPVIGNGDIKSSYDVLKMFNETGCDAVMIARASLGNPWFFKETKAYLNGSVLPENPSILLVDGGKAQLNALTSKIKNKDILLIFLYNFLL